MIASPLLLADAETIKIILAIVAGLIWLVQHYISSNAKGQARRPPAKPEARPRPPAAPAGKPQMPGDVNEFLRRAAEKRAAEKRAAQRPMANEPAQPPRRLVTTKLDAPPGEVVEAQAVDESRSMTRIGSYVEQHLGTREEAAAQFTDVDKSEAMFQAHLQQTFQHHVGQLDSQASDPATAAPAADSPLAALLADPANVRQAIVLNEILQRPVDRWQ